MSNVERAAEVIGKKRQEMFALPLNEQPHEPLDVIYANALADAGIIPRDEAEITVEWAHLTKHNTIKPWPAEIDARERAATLDRPVLRRTVTEWEVVDDEHTSE